MRMQTESEIWAHQTFGKADLRDPRRSERLALMVARAIENPCGKISKVFKCTRERGGAYDFVENVCVPTARLERAVGKATAKSCVGAGRVRVAVDGSSANIVDETGEKEFGRIGTDGAGAKGLKVMTALAIGPDGGTIGVLAQSYWVRPPAAKRSRRQKRAQRARKKPEEKETRFWLETIERARIRLDAVGALGSFHLDREGDAWPILMALDAGGHWFTVRSAWNRVCESSGRSKQYLRERIAATRPIATYDLDVPGSKHRKARRAKMVMRATKLTLRLRDKQTTKIRLLTVNVVWVREHGTTPRGEKPLDWMLLTNAPISTAAEAHEVVKGYTTRWRIEDFHKTWKSGACNVEHMQLRSPDAAIRWATILAVAAARIERLKHLSRNEPDRPASDELQPIEVEVLVALKRRYKSRNEVIPDGMPSIALAVCWIAEMGGYNGKSSGGPPGSITIARGLDHLRAGVEAVLAMRSAER